ncbi:MBL fold metallo-hydrolase [Conexibacter woesei]|uniref:Beta-lactamase domain protein n=1 Tax=Conexibacter woesei (strain DSM 14684 / CCUG 47730 / CIP 108061 / JCM 11494 / NBRC 100937 / ID131577) TaxID=469383 RepID=D3F4Y1_CONWI|nr:MBL fold metallo-hydrolase [Conexibacter woesei]ADB48559.1 beta-lactamase domain protein [Conexibacter woesei DSM 14684]
MSGAAGVAGASGAAGASAVAGVGGAAGAAGAGGVGRIARIVEPLDDGRFLSVFLLVGARGAVLVDTGLAATPERTIGPALAARGLGWEDLTAVVVTHADVDHAGGLGAVRRLAPQATTICGARDRALIESAELLLERRYREFRADHAIDQSRDFVAWVRANADDGTIDAVFDGDATLTVDDGTVTLARPAGAAPRDDRPPADPARGGPPRDAGAWRVSLLAVPGHTAGHLALHDAASGTAIAADAVLGAAAPGADGAPAFAPTYRFLPAYRDTIARLRGLGAERLLCSHLEPLDGAAAGAYLDESAAFATALERALLSSLADGREATLAQLIALAAPAVATWPPDANHTLAQPLLGHVEELCARGRIRRRPGLPARYALA